MTTPVTVAMAMPVVHVFCWGRHCKDYCVKGAEKFFFLMFRITDIVFVNDDEIKEDEMDQACSLCSSDGKCT
jgi:hypothetical protein